MISLPVLNRRFEAETGYAPCGAYRLLPMHFTELDAGRARYVATGFAGEYIVLPRENLQRILSGELSPADPLYDELATKHFLVDDTSDVALELLAAKYRTRVAPLAEFTGLHIFVVTLRCDHSCPYCQVSRVSDDRGAFDMLPETALAAIDLMFRSPNPQLKVEFQGGESLLNFDLIRLVVEEVERRNADEERDIEYVVATNLAPLSDEMLDFFREHGILISTSLDGPADLHNANRPRPGRNSHELAIEGIERCRAALGEHAVSALMTTTRRSLTRARDIIDEYRNRGFHSVFLRWLSPYGFASRSANALGYPAEEWARFYEEGLRYTLGLANAGEPIREELATIIAQKMLSSSATGYVDLQSPTGLGTSVVVYNYDGDVYASDESRMLAETGDRSFRLGSVRDGYDDLFASDRLLDILLSTMTEATPSCAWCAFEPYCGADPVMHHALQGDMVGHRPTSPFCHRNMSVFRLLVGLMEDDPVARNTLENWASWR